MLFCCYFLVYDPLYISHLSYDRGNLRFRFLAVIFLYLRLFFCLRSPPNPRFLIKKHEGEKILKDFLGFLYFLAPLVHYLKGRIKNLSKEREVKILYDQKKYCFN